MATRDRADALAAGDILRSLNTKIVATIAELSRVQAKAAADVAEIQAQIALLQKIKAALSTDKESWLLDLVNAGVL